MIALRGFWRNLIGRAERVETRLQTKHSAQVAILDLDIAPNDPLVLYFQSTPDVVDIERLDIDSPALDALREAHVKLVVPLVSQGELIGIINLGPRLSEQDYSIDDRKLLNDLATQAAPAVRVAQLARQQQAEARERERLEQELRVARLIQQTLLPQQLPDLPGYEIAAYYQPAREVGGDFYDFLYFDDGQVGIIIGDVTDKGVPAALVMATTRTLLRAAAERFVSPSQVLERVNELLHPDIPRRMFVTCLYALLDPSTGRLRYANAGHDLPYRRAANGVDELRATGMPLGLMPGMQYEEKEIVLAVDDTVLFHSDGLVEAHNVNGEMFGFPRLQMYVGQHAGGAALIPHLLEELKSFTGPDWEQEDDVTLVILQRAAMTTARGSATTKDLAMKEKADVSGEEPNTGNDSWQMVAEFELASEPGNEQTALKEVAARVQEMNLSLAKLERLKTAVAEATMNAMEHGNKYDPELSVTLQVLTHPSSIAVRIIDHGNGNPILRTEAPDLEAKLAGKQSPRGWGLFLIENMVDELNISGREGQHVVELIMHLEEGGE